MSKVSLPLVLIDMRGRLGAYAAPLPKVAQARLGRLAAQLGLGPSHELSLLLTDNPTIQKLNRSWRGMDKPTDVLSFPLHALKAGAPPPPGALGDIVISLPYTRRAAQEEGLSLEYHLTHFLLHGLLHLLGFDHEQERDARKMEREERRLLAMEFPE